ncbi:MAG: hypothetical protein JXD21_03535 [Candidatus Omnitrophica bacterium]|nr:hypothetical protein [Candidatus Omnitrophota bacterium]
MKYKSSIVSILIIIGLILSPMAAYSYIPWEDPDTTMPGDAGSADDWTLPPPTPEEVFPEEITYYWYDTPYTFSPQEQAQTGEVNLQPASQPSPSDDPQDLPPAAPPFVGQVETSYMIEIVLPQITNTAPSFTLTPDMVNITGITTIFLNDNGTDSPFGPQTISSEYCVDESYDQEIIDFLTDPTTNQETQSVTIDSSSLYTLDNGQIDQIYGGTGFGAPRTAEVTFTPMVVTDSESQEQFVMGQTEDGESVLVPINDAIAAVPEWQTQVDELDQFFPDYGFEIDNSVMEAYPLPIDAFTTIDNDTTSYSYNPESQTMNDDEDALNAGELVTVFPHDQNSPAIPVGRYNPVTAEMELHFIQSSPDLDMDVPASDFPSQPYVFDQEPDIEIFYEGAADWWQLWGLDEAGVDSNMDDAWLAGSMGEEWEPEQNPTEVNFFTIDLNGSEPVAWGEYVDPYDGTTHTGLIEISWSDVETGINDGTISANIVMGMTTAVEDGIIDVDLEETGPGLTAHPGTIYDPLEGFANGIIDETSTVSAYDPESGVALILTDNVHGNTIAGIMKNADDVFVNDYLPDEFVAGVGTFDYSFTGGNEDVQITTMGQNDTIQTQTVNADNFSSLFIRPGEAMVGVVTAEDGTQHIGTLAINPDINIDNITVSEWFDAETVNTYMANEVFPAIAAQVSSDVLDDQLFEEMSNYINQNSSDIDLAIMLTLDPGAVMNSLNMMDDIINAIPDEYRDDPQYEHLASGALPYPEHIKGCFQFAMGGFGDGTTTERAIAFLDGIVSFIPGGIGYLADEIGLDFLHGGIFDHGAVVHLADLASRPGSDPMDMFFGTINAIGGAAVTGVVIKGAIEAGVAVGGEILSPVLAGEITLGELPLWCSTYIASSINVATTGFFEISAVQAAMQNPISRRAILGALTIADLYGAYQGAQSGDLTQIAFAELGPGLEAWFLSVNGIPLDLPDGYGEPVISMDDLSRFADDFIPSMNHFNRVDYAATTLSGSNNKVDLALVAKIVNADAFEGRYVDRVFVIADITDPEVVLSAAHMAAVGRDPVITLEMLPAFLEAHPEVQNPWIVAHGINQQSMGKSIFSMITGKPTTGSAEYVRIVTTDGIFDVNAAEYAQILDYHGVTPDMNVTCANCWFAFDEGNGSMIDDFSLYFPNVTGPNGRFRVRIGGDNGFMPPGWEGPNLPLDHFIFVDYTPDGEPAMIFMGEGWNNWPDNGINPINITSGPPDGDDITSLGLFRKYDDQEPVDWIVEGGYTTDNFQRAMYDVDQTIDLSGLTEWHREEIRINVESFLNWANNTNAYVPPGPFSDARSILAKLDELGY